MFLNINWIVPLVLCTFGNMWKHGFKCFALFYNLSQGMLNMRLGPTVSSSCHNTPFRQKPLSRIKGLFQTALNVLSLMPHTPLRYNKLNHTRLIIFFALFAFINVSACFSFFYCYTTAVVIHRNHLLQLLASLLTLNCSDLLFMVCADG